MKDRNPKTVTFWFLFWPLLIEQFFQLLLGNVDIFMLSHYSDESVSAVGLANQLLVVASLIFGFVSIGTSVILVQLQAGQKLKQASLVTNHAFVLNSISGIFISIVLVLFAENLLEMMQAPASIMEEGKIYLAVVGGSIVLQALMATFGAVFRSFNFVKEVMYISVFINILNIIGNYLVLMTSLPLPVEGVEGVAYATVISRVIGTGVFIWLFLRKFKEKLPWVNPFLIKKETTFSILKLGIPSAGEHVSYNLSQTVITGMIALMGTVVLTTKIYTQTISGFVFIVSFAIAQTTQLLVGRLIGEDKKEIGLNLSIKIMIRALIISFSLSLIIYGAASFIVPIFTDNPDIISLTTTLLLLAIFLEPARAANVVLIGSLNAAGDVRFPVIIGIISMWVICVPLSYVVGVHFGFGLVGIWMVFILDEWLRAFLLLWRWKSRSWMKIVLRV